MVGCPTVVFIFGPRWCKLIDKLGLVLKERVGLLIEVCGPEEMVCDFEVVLKSVSYLKRNL